MNVAKNCDDGNVCTQDFCDEIFGCDSNALKAAACDDGNACTGNDTCSDGACAGVAIQGCE